MKYQSALLLFLIASQGCMPLTQAGNKARTKRVHLEAKRRPKKKRENNRRNRTEKGTKADKIIIMEQRILPATMMLISFFFMYSSHRKTPRYIPRAPSNPNTTSIQPVQNGPTNSSTQASNVQITASQTTNTNGGELNTDYKEEKPWVTDPTQTLPDDIITLAETIVGQESVEDWTEWIHKPNENLGKKLHDFLEKEGFIIHRPRVEGKTYLYIFGYEKLMQHRTKYSALALAYLLRQAIILCNTAFHTKNQANLHNQTKSLVRGNSKETLLGEALRFHQKDHKGKHDKLTSKQQDGEIDMLPIIHVLMFASQFEEALSEDGEYKYFLMQDVEIDETHFGKKTINALAEDKEGVDINGICKEYTIITEALR